MNNEKNQQNISTIENTKKISVNITDKKIGELVKNVEIIKDNKTEENIIIKSSNKINKISNFFSYLLVFTISFVALIILLDTLKYPLINVFPRLEIILFNLFEILIDIKLFIIDLT